jgi:hypothetical protein
MACNTRNLPGKSVFVEPQNLRFGGGVGHSMVSPIVLLAVLIAGGLILTGSRSRALAAFLGAALLIPTDQVLLLGPAHFPMLRLLIIFGAIRMFRTKGKLLPGGWNKIDNAMVVLTVVTAIAGILLYQQSAVVIFQLGNMYSALGAYFILRFLIRDEEDVLLVIRILVYISLFVAIIMTYEQATGKNPIYAYLGGAHAQMYGSAAERDDRFRATGCFGHPILAGTFGAISLPLFVGLWWRDKKYRTLAGLGVLAAVVMAVTANSSTALLGFAGGVIGLAFWPMRNWMRPVRWTILLTIVSLHLVMKAPVWHLISRIDLAGGSSSYHRYQLINQCILHFSDWWLIGTKFYADWGWDMFDLSDQYVLTADTAGLIPLAAFVGMIVYGFKYVGRARRIAVGERRRELLVWALGASLFANVVAFMGIGYFDQTIVAWYTLVVMIPVAAYSARQAVRKRKANTPQLAAVGVESEAELPAAQGNGR